MKLSILGLALVISAGCGSAAFADTTITHESVGLDLNAAGGTDMSGSGGLRQTSKQIVVQSADSKKTKVTHRRPRRAAFNTAAELALPKII